MCQPLNVPLDQIPNGYQDHALQRQQHENKNTLLPYWVDPDSQSHPTGEVSNQCLGQGITAKQPKSKNIQSQTNEPAGTKSDFLRCRKTPVDQDQRYPGRHVTFPFFPNWKRKHDERNYKGGREHP
ncbi:uncharacterized protein METZ01_LOCUS167963 [marine metagenome]|uniref:Uncharacterized protein n=1 Tax=marine metagenome TaxID=408172 RepID=A0A382BNA4_9ZZZZ